MGSPARRLPSRRRVSPADAPAPTDDDRTAAEHRLPVGAILRAQGVGLAAAAAWWWLAAPGNWRDPLVVAFVQGSVAALTAAAAGAPRWWWAIHLGFLPLVVAALRLDVAPGWYLAAFAALALVFGRTDATRVPLFLTNRTTADTLAALLPPVPCTVTDLGCGLGGVLLRLARARPDARFVGVERAPLPWLVARLRAGARSNVEIRRGDLFEHDLRATDVCYAFLSPAPMARLQDKLGVEMNPGTLFVSNSFPLPGAAPDAVCELADRRGTRLYRYRLPLAAPFD